MWVIGEDWFQAVEGVELLRWAGLESRLALTEYMFLAGLVFIPCWPNSGGTDLFSGPIREKRTRPKEDELGKPREKSHKSPTLTLSIRSRVAHTWIIDRVVVVGCTAPQPHTSGWLVLGGHRPGRHRRTGCAAQQPSEPEAHTQRLRPGLHRRR